MKKTLTLLAVVLLTTVAMSAQSLFSTQFKTIEDFEKWTVIDSNGDGSTWKFDDWGSPSYVFYSYNGANAGDDWLISPEIVPVKTGTVAVTYTFYGSSYSESMEVYVGKSTTLADFGTALATYPVIKDVMHNGYVLVDAKEGEAFRVAFHATTPKDRFRLFICSVEAKHIDVAMDLGVTEISNPVTAMGLGQESVTIKVKNFATNDASEFDLSYQIDGNDAVVEKFEGTLKAGEETEYTFATKADLSTPRKMYKIRAFTSISDDLNTSNDTCSVSVRHQAPAAAPYFLGFEAEEDLSGISYFNLNNDSGEWSIDDGGWFSLAYTGDGCLAYNYDSNNAGDDWAILEPINVDPGYYVLKFWYSATDNHPEKLSVHYGNGSTPEAMTTKILEINPMSNSKYEEAIVILSFEEAQQVSFGFYSFSPKNENWILIDDLSFDKVNGDDIDLAVGNVSAPFDFVRPGNSTNVELEVRNLGIKDVDAKVSVIIDGNTAHNQSIFLKGQEIKSVSFVNILADLAVGKHSLSIEVKAENDAVTENNTISKEIVVLGDATMFWNFEDGTVPSDFTFTVGDTGTINPNAGDEFNEQGWGIIKVSTHEMLGNYVFAGTSWIDGVDKADRYVTLPAVDITSEDSYFVWDANSFNEGFPERYSILVQDNTSSYPYFSTVYSQAAESVKPTTRGLSLAEYVGKNISIQFNLTTANGDCVIFDNIGIYNGLQSGIENVVNSANMLVISENEVVANGAETIVLTDMLGRVVKSAEGETLSLSEVTEGLYIVMAKTADGVTSSCKFVKK